MAEGHRPVEVVRPEQRIARRFLLKSGLKPPVDVAGLAAKLANVEDVKLPVDADAVLVGKSAQMKRPLIIMNSDRPPRRRRFTLAHEIGHIVISWHVGTISCHIAGNEDPDADLYHALEAEANRFAAELLMPFERLSIIARDAGTVDDKLASVIGVFDVSKDVAVIGLSRVLRPGHILVVVDDTGTIRVSCRSPSTSANPPPRGSQFEPKRYLGTEPHRCPLDSSSEEVYWWQFGDAPLTQANDLRSATEVLNGILRAVSKASTDRAALQRRINGIVGAASGSWGFSSPEAILGLLQQRMSGRPDLDSVIRHTDFPIYLSKRAKELYDRHGKA